MPHFYTSIGFATGELDDLTPAIEQSILRKIATVSSRIDLEMGFGQLPARPFFLPYIGSRTYKVTPLRINSHERTFKLQDAWLSITAVGVNDTALVVGTDVAAFPIDDPPIMKLRLTDNICRSWYTATCDDTAAPLYVTVTGIHGFHRDPAGAWQTVTTLAANLDSSATTMTANDLEATDAYGFTPILSAGAFVRIESEYLVVGGVNSGVNQVSPIVRAAHGSTAAAHASGAAVEVFQIDPELQRVVARQAGFMHARRGAYDSRSISDFGSTSYPADLLTELRAVLQEYQWWVG